MSASSAAPVPPAPLGPSPKEFLLSTPRGAYTTLCVRRCTDGSGGGGIDATASSSSADPLSGLELIDWRTHLERLVRSLRAMHAALDGAYARYYGWLEASGTTQPAALQQLVAPAVKAALVAAALAEPAAQHLMLVLVLPPAPDQPCGLAVHALAVACAAPGSAPGSAVVLGGPRGVPEGKDSGWVAQRAPLELLRPPGAAEVLLCTAEGRLLEGLVTNLFVVVADEAASASRSAEGGSEGNALTSVIVGGGAAASAAAPRLTVWMAGTHDGVVWGTARVHVLEACRRLGYDTREEAPDAAHRHSWREAFLTNSLRLVQPLHSVACGAANVWGLPPWEVRFDAAPGPVTAALAAAVTAALPTCRATDL